MEWLAVGFGGALGASARYGTGLIVNRLLGAGFPWGTMGINIIGSLAMGLLMAWLMKRAGSDVLRLFLATGFLGGFTTFSAFSLDFANLIERGAFTGAGIYLFGSVVLSILSLFIGLWFGRVVL